MSALPLGSVPGTRCTQIHGGIWRAENCGLDDSFSVTTVAGDRQLSGVLPGRGREAEVGHPRPQVVML